MPQQNEAIPSARVKVFLVPPAGTGRQPLPVGLVEDVSVPGTYRSENFTTVGDSHPVDSVVNFMEGAVRFTKVYQDNDDVNRTIVPRMDEFASYSTFDLLAVDPKDNRPIVMAQGCLPQNLDFNARGGMAPRMQYSGICRAVLRGAELQQAMAA